MSKFGAYYPPGCQGTPYDEDDGVTELQDKVLELLEAAKMPTDINDAIIALIVEGEKRTASMSLPAVATGGTDFDAALRFKEMPTTRPDSAIIIVTDGEPTDRLGAIRRDYENKIDFRSSTYRDWDQLINRHAIDRLGGLHVQARDKGYRHLVILRRGGNLLWDGGPVKLQMFLWMEEHIKGLYTIRSLIADSETTAAKQDDAIFFFKNADDAARFEARWVK